MIKDYLYGGYSDVGYKRETNEDYVSILDFDDALFAVIADGAGSKASQMQPASIATREINEMVETFYKEDKDTFMENPELILKQAMLLANRVLGAFKVANEELYGGFGVSLTCCFLTSNNDFIFAHTGNTRLYLIRVNEKDGGIRINQITQDQTKAQALVYKGIISTEEYHTHPDRLVVTGGLGLATEPEIQTYSGKIRDNDFILLTTDGIHYAIRPDPMAEIVVRSDKCDDATHALVEAAKSQNYNDNMSSIVLFKMQEQ